MALSNPYEPQECRTIAAARRVLSGAKLLVPMYYGTGTTLVPTPHESVYRMIREGYPAYLRVLDDSEIYQNLDDPFLVAAAFGDWDEDMFIRYDGKESGA